MGFRSTFITEDLGGIKLPQWFLEKYKDAKGLVPHEDGLCVALVSERKFYQSLDETEIFLDLQKVLKEKSVSTGLAVVLMHECGGVTLVNITENSIKGKEPSEWEEVDSVMHNYCYGCSK